MQSSGDDILSVFLVECEDLIGEMQEVLRRFDRGDAPDPVARDAIQSLLRSVHTIKGGALAFELSDLQVYCHTYEDALSHLKTGPHLIDAAIYNALASATDELTDHVEAVRQGTPSRKSDLTAADRLRDHLGLAGSLDGGVVRVTFRPEAGAYEADVDLADIIERLSQFGPATTTCHHDDVRQSDDHDPAEPAIWWDVRILAATDLDMIKAIAGETTPHFTSHFTITDQPQRDTLGEDVATDDLGLFATPSESVGEGSMRVDLARIERLVSLSGELMIAQSMLAREASGYGSTHPVTSASETLGRLAKDIQDCMVMIRAQPVRSLFRRMDRVLREAVARTGKPARLVTRGEETEIDKIVLDTLSEPLTHILRNAVDHGIEADRANVGKSEEATITMTASHRSGQVIITLADDGAGIDHSRILKEARSRGLLSRDDDADDLTALLTIPGFTTSTTVSEMSGRGVGLDVVQSVVNRLGGRLSISSELGRGTEVRLTVPLTLAVMEGLILEVGKETVVVPLNAIEETISLKDEQQHTISRLGRVTDLGGEPLPIRDLADMLRFPRRASPASNALIVRRENGQRVAIAIDRIADQGQVVIKGLPDAIMARAGISGATILGNGQIAMIVDPLDLLSFTDAWERNVA